MQRYKVEITGKQAEVNQTIAWVAIYMDCREILLPTMTDQLKYHLERQEDLEACCQLLSNILEVLYKKDVVSMGQLWDEISKMS
ncbi:hypothetical protein WISP_01262 [Willisornis vidua]|uniref:Dedicator of cytokinesis TPR repeats region domain-containing protein n=1 Tax=Willisornis vidua TaxID=1566151 RepID=A0ABQ9E098_9PASS|nr:hypothetical protein WISP_01262 [Willisornis vidua]